VTLAAFQDAFIDALYDPTDAARQPGFRVYRNSIMKACVDALQANFPTVDRLVGTEWFRAAALVHARTTAPTDVRLLTYGHDFPAFLASFEAARSLPYLAGVAQLDRYWIEAHMAAEGAILDPAGIAALPPTQLGQTVLQPHAATRWAWFEQLPVHTIWSKNRAQADVGDELAWVGEGALLTRVEGSVRSIALDRGGCVFMDACAAGHTLERAADQAIGTEPALDIAILLRDLLTAGAFASEPSH
jgi:hypothetical protein